MQVRNKQELDMFISQALKIITKVIMEEIEKLNDKSIQKKVYDYYTPKAYERSPKESNFASAWESEVKSLHSRNPKIQGVFGYEPSNMNLNISKFQHGSPYSSPDDFRENLAETIYEGLAGDLFGEGPWRTKRDAWSFLIEQITERRMRTWISKGAKETGIRIKF